MVGSPEENRQQLLAMLSGKYFSNCIELALLAIKGLVDYCQLRTVASDTEDSIWLTITHILSGAVSSFSECTWQCPRAGFAKTCIYEFVSIRNEVSLQRVHKRVNYFFTHVFSNGISHRKLKIIQLIFNVVIKISRASSGRKTIFYQIAKAAHEALEP